jgi:DNA repair protein RecO (recombination protein O)
MLNETFNGIVLSRRNIGEADRLLTILTPEKGKIKVIARGSRRIKSKMACHVEPFTKSKFQIVTGKSFYILTGVEKDPSFCPVFENIETYKDAVYLCEIIDLTIQDEEKCEKIYELLIELLDIFPKITTIKREILTRYFEFTLLSFLGYKPNYKKCSKCGGEIIERNSFTGTFEGVLCCDCESASKSNCSISKNAIKILNLFKETKVSEILKLSINKTINQEISMIIKPYLYDILPREPKAHKL